MRLAWATDVHLDFLSSTEIDTFADRIAALSPDSVLLSGDISTAPRLDADLERLAGRLERPIFFVLGNHDFYGGSVQGVRSVARRLTETERQRAAQARKAAMVLRLLVIILAALALVAPSLWIWQLFLKAQARGPIVCSDASETVIGSNDDLGGLVGHVNLHPKGYE